MALTIIALLEQKSPWDIISTILKWVNAHYSSLLFRKRDVEGLFD
jgi:hypothetical protein